MNKTLAKSKQINKQQSANEVLLRAKWILPIKSEPIEDGAVLVRGTKIEKVGTFASLGSKYKQAKIKDFGLAVLMPGFVNLHTHLQYSVFRGVCDDLPYAKWKIQTVSKSKKLSENDWKISAELGGLEAVKSGITTIADISRNDASLKAVKQSGLRAVIFHEISGLDHRNVDNIFEEAVRRINDLEKEAKSCEGSLISVGIAPHSPYMVAPPLFKLAADFAKKNKMLLSIHLAGSKEEYEFVKYASGPLALEFKELSGNKEVLWQPTGVSPVKYLEQWDAFEADTIAVHCIQVDEKDLDILQKYNVSLVHCPRCGAKLGMGIAPLKSFKRRKLKVGLGTDSPASNNTMDFFEEMRVGLLLQRGSSQSTEGFSAEDFIRMATLEGANILNLDKKVGSLEEGKDADIIAVDLSQSYQIPAVDPYSAVVYTASQENVLFTMVAGKVLYEAQAEDLAKEIPLDAVDKIRAKLKKN